MNPSHPTNDSELPVIGETACGGRIKISPNTPSILYRDEVIYFCGWDCKQLYDEDPLNSCLAARLLSGN
jgi:hypothetical protein